MRFFLLLPLVLFAVAGCKPARDGAAEAKAFKNYLAQTIREADEIRIVEYPSGENDHEHQHRSSTLDAEQKKLLEQLVLDTPPAEQDEFRACFIPHHSIRFFKNGVQDSELEVCLNCGEVRLRSTHSRAPKAMFATISGFMEPFGYSKLTSEEKKSRAAARRSISTPADIPAQPEPPQTAEDK